MRHRALEVAAILAASLPALARAQQTAPASASGAERAGSWEESLGAAAAYLDPQIVDLVRLTDSTRRVVPGVAVRLGYNLGRSWNFSIGSFVGSTSPMTVLQPFGAISWTPNIDWKVSPFLTLGVGFSNIDWNGYLARSQYGAHVGAGLRVMLAQRVALRIEVREQYEKFSDATAFPSAAYNGTGTLGLSFFTAGSRTAVASVVVTPPMVTLEALGATLQLAAAPKDEAGRPLSGRAVRWSSSNDSIATVTDGGLVTAAADGTATITAASEGAAGTATVRVAQAPAALAIAPAGDTLTALGQTVRLAVSAQDANDHAVAAPPVTWASSNPAAVSVSATGLVTATGNDTATITATAGGMSATTTITVRQAVVSVSVTPPGATIAVDGGAVQFTAEAYDANRWPVTGKVITWSDSTPSVATLSSNGLATAAGNGTTVIVATVDGVSGAATLTVDIAPAAVVAAPAPAPVAVPVLPAPAMPAVTLPTVGAAPVILRDVSFRPNSAVLPPEARAELDAVAHAILAIPNARWQIAGYTSSMGNAERNRALSRRRALAVRAYLIRSGVPATRLVAVGYGARNPIASNATVAGRRANMRVEFRRLR
jgi:outer membrane protein OmpA-like peptidoglycan-associated protein